MSRAFCLLPLMVLLVGCSKKYDMQFCFTTIVNGEVFVAEAIVGDAYAPCGMLSAGGGTKSNSEFDFDKLPDLCGSIASGYRMELPDSAFISWSSSKGPYEGYRKRLSLPPFPPIRRDEKYRIGFCIGYQDCVYVRIETIPNHNYTPFFSLENMIIAMIPILLLILYLLYIINIMYTLAQIPKNARKIAPALSFLNILPGVNFIWHFITAIYISKSMKSALPPSRLENESYFGRKTGIVLSIIQLLYIPPVFVILRYPLSYSMYLLLILIFCLWFVLLVRYNILLFQFRKRIRIVYGTCQ